MDRIEENVDTAAEHVQTGEEEIRVVGSGRGNCTVRVVGKWGKLHVLNWSIYDVLMLCVLW